MKVNTNNIKAGNEFGDWTVQHVEYGPLGAVTKLIAVCKCGTVSSPSVYQIRSGHSGGCRACGQQKIRDKAGVFLDCLDKDQRKRMARRIYNIIQRCTNPEDSGWDNYGGRGISVYPPWLDDRGAFLRYLMQLPGWDDPDLSLDRINNFGNYEPGNLRFTTMFVQAANRGQRIAPCPHCHCPLLIQGSTVSLPPETLYDPAE